MKTIRTILSIILLLSLFSCTKFGKNVTVKGRVLNPITGEGISGVQIILKRSTLGGAPGFQSGGSKIIKETTTDENGYYELNKLTLSGSVLMSAHIGDRHPIGWWKGGSYSSFQNLPIDLGKTTHADFHAVPYGKLRYTIKNVSCFDQYDSLLLYTNYQLSNVSEYQNSRTYLGCFEYVGTVYTKFPMGWYYFSGNVIKNNITTSFKDSIFITNGGKHEWLFYY
ncbi:MAG: carboxypeptidase-like regulatory domain-containing protein [Brumimicrobium sp.]|nr:carboxypeptidase-like regulatory domain-containing protein [Brumimicrobium sp.]